GAVHRLVGALDQLLGVARAGLGESYTDARTQLCRSASQLVGPFQRRADALPGMHRDLEVAQSPQQHEELVAAEAAELIAGAHRRPETFGDLDQHLVARSVAEGVVDLLEVVEVEVGQSHLVPVLELAGERCEYRGTV